MANFDAFLHNFANDFKSFTDEEKNRAIELILKLCGPEQLRFLSKQLQHFVKRDFIKFLPTELAHNILKFLDYKSIARCCMVSKVWNNILANYTEVWINACHRLGVAGFRGTNQVNIDWKSTLKNALGRVKRLKRSPLCSFSKRKLIGHTERVTALCYKDGFLASGSDDRTIRLWDVKTGACQRVLICHTCSDLKFDQTQVVTASFDNTLARWEWSTGSCLTKYQGHVGAVLCVDYNTELDLVVSGSSDCTVKIWQMSSGSCLSTKLGHQTWLIAVLLAPFAQQCRTEFQRKHVIVSMSKDCIKLWSVNALEDYQCIKSMSIEQVPVNRYLPKLLCNGRDILLGSDQGVCIWNLETFQLTRLLKQHDHILVAFGDIFSLCWKNNVLHILLNKMEQCISEIPIYWSNPISGFRYFDCAGETKWLNDCSSEMENGPLYFGKHGKDIILIEWIAEDKGFHHKMNTQTV